MIHKIARGVRSSCEMSATHCRRVSFLSQVNAAWSGPFLAGTAFPYFFHILSILSCYLKSHRWRPVALAGKTVKEEDAMKRKLMVVITLAAAMIGGGTGAVLAGYGPGGGFDGPPPHMGMGGGEERMAKILKLTETQQSQIKTVLDTERELVEPLFGKMHESRKLLMQAAETTVFDEAAVRAIASDQASIETELTVSRTRAHSRINALLTPEQRELMKNLGPER
jgi:Spy/CpxP family protein refolding chaperone